MPEISVKVRGLAAAALVLVAAAMPASALAASPALSGAAMLQRLTDPVAALAPLPAGVRPLMVSSHDRLGGNVDGGSYGGPITTLGMIPPAFARREGGDYVLFETHRPGCLLRTFMGAVAGPGDSAAGFGRLRVFIDGEPKPRFDRPAADLFKGRVPGYPKTLVGDEFDSSGGNFAYVPFCFSRSVQVRTSSMPFDGLGWWQLGLVVAPAGTRVKTFDPGAGLGAYAARLGAAGTIPRTRPRFRADLLLAPGQTGRVTRLRGAGTIRSMRFVVTPFDIATLQGLSLRVKVGRGAPEIDVPLGSLFGDGVETTYIKSLGFGMSPRDRTGYFSLPVPYTREATVAIAARRPAHVSIEGWTGRRAPAGAGTLYGEHQVQRAPIGADTPVLAARGSGRVASVVMDYVDGGPLTGVKGLQRFLEGDERIAADGSRSPSFYGTGHEELSNGGFYFTFGAFTLPLAGAGPLGTLPNADGTQSQYRLFGPEGPRWSRSIAYDHEHGGGDELLSRVGITTFSYRGRTRLARTDSVAPGDGPSETAHRMTGPSTTTQLTAYFEGQHDGNGTDSTIVAGGFYYLAPPAAQSKEGVRGTGVTFSGPLATTLRVDRRNKGVVLRGLFDQATPVALAVAVDGKPAGLWESTAGAVNPAKRWLEEDFDLPPRLTARKKRVRVRLTPLRPGATLFGLQALSRR